MRYKIIFICEEWPVFIPLTYESTKNQEWIDHCFKNARELPEHEKQNMRGRIPQTIVFWRNRREE